MAKKEFKVGEVFQCGLVKLKCVEKSNNSIECKFCFLVDYAHCFDIIGECDKDRREDGKDVIFVKMEG